MKENNNMAERLLNIATKLDLTTEICCNCGMLFAMPAELQARMSETGRTFYCPNGHTQYYTKSTEAKLREAQERLREQTAYSNNLAHQLDGALKQVSIKRVS